MGLIDQICSNRAFRRRLQESRCRLFRVALAWSSEESLAEDLTQETLARALERREQLRDLDAMHKWLLTILGNLWRDHLRRQHPSDDIDEVRHATDVTPEHRCCSDQAIRRVRQCIARLPAGQRAVITLVELEEMSYREVSEILDIPIGTVMSRLNRARQTLKDRLIRERGSEPGQRPSLRRVV